MWSFYKRKYAIEEVLTIQTKELTESTEDERKFDKFCDRNCKVLILFFGH